ncbi:hypothetical protein JG687_00015250 [Phytophthora cactorum]|uniref:P-loop containing nucleoside triphosphate hydrolase n=1 Tax=Phytophthora cactorum TaxID=29920 RepID=A0A329RU14_9STRA|nr:hypothetical protein Pcac1_g16720 [Phytophthora cactorum]KAG2776182.1 hypothetical protein Pcac1_g13402 [Phytophthora cactorum]KAG2804802.1 hypothetical protein PC112_g18558 [Phytophthora cactorum]KAG2806114.1 hypothetical protein PC111_g17519 [Phytophthora cactorum]KAG2843914.1 hypothetical protein PC113_g18507 [Phytophthora cactorum]
METKGAAPSTFRTYREETVNKFFGILFPLDGGLHLPVVFVRAPPLSGKSGLCDFLYNYIVDHRQDALVAGILANVTKPGESLASLFNDHYGGTLQKFRTYKSDRVVLIDQAQITYDDVWFWTGDVKNALDSRSPGLRFVLFSSYGSFDPYCSERCSGTPVEIPLGNTFGLNATESKPSLQ